MKKSLLAFLLTAMIAVMAGCGSTSSSSSSSSDGSASSTGTVSTAADGSQDSKPAADSKDASGWTKIGKAVEYNKIEVTVNAIKKVDADDQPGQLYCMLDITVKNGTDQEKELDSISLVDSKDFEYIASSSAAEALKKNGSLAELKGPVPAGGEVKGGLVYRVSPKLKDFKFTIKDSSGNKLADIDIKN